MCMLYCDTIIQAGMFIVRPCYMCMLACDIIIQATLVYKYGHATCAYCPVTPLYRPDLFKGAAMLHMHVGLWHHYTGQTCLKVRPCYMCMLTCDIIIQARLVYSVAMLHVHTVLWHHYTGQTCSYMAVYNDIMSCKTVACQHCGPSNNTACIAQDNLMKVWPLRHAGNATSH